MLLNKDSKSTQFSSVEPPNFVSETVECGIGTVGRAATGAVAFELCAVDVPNDVNEVVLVVFIVVPVVVVAVDIVSLFYAFFSYQFFFFLILSMSLYVFCFSGVALLSLSIYCTVWIC